MAAAAGGSCARWRATMADRLGAWRSSICRRAGGISEAEEAYELTYTSCQESGKYDGLYRRLAANMGTDPSSIRFALKRL